MSNTRKAVIAYTDIGGYFGVRKVIEHRLGISYQETMRTYWDTHGPDFLAPGTYVLYVLSDQTPPQMTGLLFQVTEDKSLSFGPGSHGIPNMVSWPPKG